MSYWVYSPLAVGAALLTESRSLSVGDTGAVIATESAALTQRLLSVSDTCLVVADDVAIEHRPSVTDTGAVILTETYLDWPHTVVVLGLSDATPAITVVIAATDSLRVVADDAATPVIDTGLTLTEKTASDSATIQASETLNTISVSAAATDSLILGAGEVVAACTGSVGATDSCRVVSDDTDVANDHHLFIIHRAFDDTLVGQINDATPTIVLVMSATDGLTVHAIDAYQPSTVAVVSSSESLSAILDEVTPGIASLCTIDDAAPCAIDDTLANGLALMSIEESLAWLAREDVWSVACVLAVDDATTVQVNDAVPALDTGIERTDLPVSDSLTGILDEATPSVLQLDTVAVDDTLVGEASESTGLLAGVTAQDALVLAGTDALAEWQAVSAADDGLRLDTAEACDYAAASAADDSLLGSLSESAQTDDAMAVDEDLQGGLAEVITFAGEPPSLLTFAVSDACTIGLDDLASTPVFPADVMAVMLLESATVTHTQVEQYWGGGMRQEEAHHLYATSTRMGHLPPDQDRGSRW